MSFFYSSPAGAVDMWVTLVVCVGVIALGRYRECALAVLLVFLIDRTALYFDRIDLIGASQVIGVIVASSINSKISRAVSVLFVAKIAFILWASLSSERWSEVVTLATVCLYLQLILVLSGATASGIRNRGRVDSPFGGPTNWSIPALASRIPLIRHSDARKDNHQAYEVSKTRLRAD